jgi:hypothetical protein
MFLIAFPIAREQTQLMVTGALAEDVTVPIRAGRGRFDRGRSGARRRGYPRHRRR